MLSFLNFAQIIRAARERHARDRRDRPTPRERRMPETRERLIVQLAVVAAVGVAPLLS